MRIVTRNLRSLKTGLIVFIVCLISVYDNSAASTDSLKFINNLGLSVEANYGYVFPHHSSIIYSLQSGITSLELNVTTNTYGYGSWDKLYRFPGLGAGYLYSTLGNDQVFGKAHALFLFMDVPFSSKLKRFSFSYRFGFGAAYLTRKFSVSENPMNVAISSSINAYASFKLNMRFLINKRNEVAAGVNFMHFSNGKVASPNLGLNCITVYAAYLFNIIPARYPRISDKKEIALEKHDFELVYSCGAKSDDQISGKYYFISTFVFDYKYVPGLKYSFGAGLDIFYDESLGMNKADDTGGFYSQTDLYQLGIHAGFYPRFSKLNIILQAGSYLYADYYKYSRIYMRLGFRYEVYNNILINITLKTHLAIADYLEWGIGYRF